MERDRTTVDSHLHLHRNFFGCEICFKMRGEGGSGKNGT